MSDCFRVTFAQRLPLPLAAGLFSGNAGPLPLAAGLFSGNAGPLPLAAGLFSGNAGPLPLAAGLFSGNAGPLRLTFFPIGLFSGHFCPTLAASACRWTVFG